MTYQDATKAARVVLIEFYASWCPHCHRMMPVVEQVKELLDGRATVTQLDIDRNEAVADYAQVQSVPTFIIYVDGEEQWRQSGEMDGEVLLNKVESYI